ncbi:MAG: alpha/beta hydrolase [Candidatus Saccharibacteria bacterium]
MGLMKVIVNGQLINYVDEGSGPVLLVLHGWGTNLNTFDQLAKHLSKDFRVIRFDFPGFGQSPKPTDDWDVTDYAKLTSDLVQKLKISKVYAVIAHSFGGRVMIKSAKLGLLNPVKVILIGSAGIKPKASAKKLVFKLIAKLGKVATSLPPLKNMRQSLRKKLYSSAGSTDYLNAEKMQPIFLKTIGEDLTSEIASITQPTLLLWGQNDTETPVADARLMLSKLTNGRLAVIDDAGHFVYQDKFEQAVAEIDRFL